MSRTARFLSALLVLLLPLLVSIQGGRNVRGVVPVYRMTFNDEPPWGTEEDESSTTGCLTHGADWISGTKHDCLYTAGVEAEGDGAMRVYANALENPSESKWTIDKLDDLTELWVKMHLYIDEGVGGNAATNYLFEVTSSGASIGGVYGIAVALPAFDWIIIKCDDQFTFGFYTDQTWIEIMLHFDLADGDVDYWLNDLTGSPDVACDGAGGDGGTPIDGFIIQGDKEQDHYRFDDVRFYDQDPR